MATGETGTLAYVDQGYTGDTPRQTAAEHGIALAVAKMPDVTHGSVFLPRWWVVEQDAGWMIWNRAAGETVLTVAAIDLFVRYHHIAALVRWTEPNGIGNGTGIRGEQTGF